MCMKTNTTVCYIGHKKTEWKNRERGAELQLQSRYSERVALGQPERECGNIKFGTQLDSFTVPLLFCSIFSSISKISPYKLPHSL